MTAKAKAQHKKQTERDCIKRMRRLTRSIERLSEGVPQTALDAMQIAGILWAGPEWLKLGPSEPSEAQISDLMNCSFEAQIKRLEAYWERSGRGV
jgi:hypothetical protein